MFTEQPPQAAERQAVIPTSPQKHKQKLKRLISSIDAEISNMQQRINAIPKGDPKRKQLLDRIAEKTVALGLLQDELQTLRH
jgi:hypothetical protein